MKSIDCIAFTFGPITEVRTFSVAGLASVARIRSENLCGKWMQRNCRSTSASLSDAGSGSAPSICPRPPRQIRVVSAFRASTSSGVKASSITQ